MLESVKHKALEQLLVGYPNLDRVTGGAVLPVPRLHEGDILCPTTTTAAEVKRSWSPEQTNPIGCVVGVEGRV